MSGNRSLRPRPRLSSDRAGSSRPYHALRPPTPAPGSRGSGWRGAGPQAAPLFAALLLAASALGTFWVANLSSSRDEPGGEGAAVTEGVQVDGSIIFARGGALWSLSGASITQVSTSTTDGEPAWSRDGTWLYFIRNRSEIGGR